MQVHSLFLCGYVKIERKDLINMAKKSTSLKIAKKASKVLKDGRSSKVSKSIAGSALSQREKK